MRSAVQTAVQIMQFGQTARWHTEINLKRQDVAQHSFNVAWFCWLLMDGAPSIALIMAALAHDAGERKTGDMPSPTKIKLGIGALLDNMEADYLLTAGYDPKLLTAEESRVLKLADALDGAFFCLRELMLGNRLVLNSEWNGAGNVYLQNLTSQANIEDGPGLIARELFEYLKERYDCCRISPRPQFR